MGWKHGSIVACVPGRRAAALPESKSPGAPGGSRVRERTDISLGMYSSAAFAAVVGQNQVPRRLLMPLLQGRLHLCLQR